MNYPLIDIDYFVGEISIGQIDQVDVSTELTLFIRKYEREFMLKLMGKPLMDAFYTNIDTTPDPTSILGKIAFGDYFKFDSTKATCCDCHCKCEMVNFEGLLKSATTDAINYGYTSPVAKYIYYWWMRSHQSVSGGVGESRQLVHNGLTITNSHKMVKAWNSMCEDVHAFYRLIDMYKSEVPMFDLSFVVGLNRKK
jgi:hypothetical protein